MNFTCIIVRHNCNWQMFIIPHYVIYVVIVKMFQCKCITVKFNRFNVLLVRCYMPRDTCNPANSDEYSHVLGALLELRTRS